jgi:hypothetical protein
MRRVAQLKHSANYSKAFACSNSLLFGDGLSAFFSHFFLAIFQELFQKIKQFRSFFIQLMTGF